MSTREYEVSYTMHVEAENPEEAAAWLAEFLTDSKAPMRGVYHVEDEDGKPFRVDLGEQNGEW